jgi:phosphatidate phosphatase APP1
MADPTVQSRLIRAVTSLETAVDARIGDYLRRRPGWAVTVVPYVGHGSRDSVSLRARLVARPLVARSHAGRTKVLVASISHYLSAEVAGEPVEVSVAGSTAQAVSDLEGYVEVTLAVDSFEPGWHPVGWEAQSGQAVPGRVMIVDPEARLGVVSDIDDTILHTGLTRLREALRTTLLVAEEERLPIPGAAELYTGLVSGDHGRAPVFYVSTGAWNLHTMLERFLARHKFPAGPMLMTDWGPGGAWLFREDSIAFKSRTIIALIDAHPHLRWVLLGDSGQHDPEAYAAVARARPGSLRAIYIREVPPQSPERARRVRELADELASQGLPLLLTSDSAAAAQHAASLGLLDGSQVARVRHAVGAGS